MDLGEAPESDERNHAEVAVSPQTPRQLPSDLPTSLDDRRAPAALSPGIEVYDAWQGHSQFLTSTAPAEKLNFNLALDDPEDDLGYLPANETSEESRLNHMLAAQAAHRHQGPKSSEEDEKMASSTELTDDEKRDGLRSALNMAASNGDIDRLKALVDGPSKAFLDVSAPDDEGTAPLIYASCFGHASIVEALLEAGANVDTQDKHRWTSLMWATANGHSEIAKVLLDKGASTEVKSATGRTAHDFVAPNSDMSGYLQDNGYKIGNAGVAGDFYNAGLSQDRLEEEMQENEMRRRMQMDSAINLEVDLGNLGFDEAPEVPEEAEEEEEQGFVWDRCLNDQMFVFQEADLPRILDIIITDMRPQRNHSQKPVPANVIFLSARYAHYHANPDLLDALLHLSTENINEVVEAHHLDMTVLAFWMSNATLLLHYLRKDPGLATATPDFQLHLTELINEIFVLIIRDAERRVDRVLDPAILTHETIPGLSDIQFKNDWNLFKSKPSKTCPKDEDTRPPNARYGPPSASQLAQTSPRNITSLLSSTLFVLDLYDVHPLIALQILSQLYYWLSAELFNRIITNRKYLSRTKALQIRMNISVLEDWARQNTRAPEHPSAPANGSASLSAGATGETLTQAATHHLTPPIQLLQWLQIFSSLSDDTSALENTISQMTRMSPQQLLHSVTYYRFEVGEASLPKAAMKRLQQLQKDATERKELRRKSYFSRAGSAVGFGGGSPALAQGQNGGTNGSGEQEANGFQDGDDAPEHLLLDSALMLPFSLPTSTDLLVSYGAGLGGVNRERARKYVPTLPPDFLQRLDAGTKLDRMTSRDDYVHSSTQDGEDEENDEHEDERSND